MSTTEVKSKTGFNKVLLVLTSILLIILLWVGITFVFPPGKFNLFAGNRPDNLGVTAGKLALCPSTPNCVNSQSQDAEHSIEPLTYKSTPDEAFANLKTIIQSLDNTKIITETEDYLYVEFTVTLLGFVDDVEFYLDKDANAIQMRSASRLGQSDLGVNRQRVEKIRAKFNEINQA